MTRRGQGQGAGPGCPPGQKQWVTLGPKYRLCGCHLGKPVPNADWGGWVPWEELRKQPVCQPLLCEPRMFVHILASLPWSTCLFGRVMSLSFPIHICLVAMTTSLPGFLHTPSSPCHELQVFSPKHSSWSTGPGVRSLGFKF